MDEEKKKKFKLKRVDILLLILLALLIWLSVGAIRFVGKTADAEQQYDREVAESDRRAADEEYEQHRSQNTGSTRTVPITDYEDQYDPYERKQWDGADTRVITAGIPEKLASRGIIFLGGKEDAGRNPGRVDTDGNAGWYHAYCTDCNLVVETNAIEFVDFVKRLGEETYFAIPREDHPAYFDATIRYNGQPFVIYRTDSIRWKLSEGEVYDDGDPGCYQPAFYDASGKYVTVFPYGATHEELLRRFLEPVMVKISVTPDINGSDVTTSENPEFIGQYIDALHELECSTSGKTAEDLLSGENVALISFTAENGRVHDYYFADGQYIIDNDRVYSAEKAGRLSELLQQ